jgi:hypothetical protein
MIFILADRTKIRSSRAASQFNCQAFSPLRRSPGSGSLLGLLSRGFYTVLTLLTLQDLEQLIAEGERESLTLEFKAGAAIANEKKGEIGKDVSAMANAAGGQIIYGIKEKDHVAAEFRPIDKRRFDHEWLEKVIRNNVVPEIEGLTIRMIDVGPQLSDVAFVVTVPAATHLAPHQAKVDLKYYRRHNFSADPMADYEIREAMRRVIAPDLRVKLKFSFDARVGDENRLQVSAAISNLSSSPASHVALSIFYDLRLPRLNNALSLFIDDANTVGTHPHDLDLRAVTALMAPPTQFPIFREHSIYLPPHVWAVRQNLLGNEPFGMGYRIAAPGCEREGYYLLQIENGELTSAGEFS